MIYEFDPVIYPRLVWVAINPTQKELDDFFEGPIPPMATTSSAEVRHARRLKPDVKAGLLVRFCNRKAVDLDTIVHESNHVAFEIFEYIGADVDTEHQEPFCYLSGWVAKCITEVKNGRVRRKEPLCQ